MDQSEVEARSSGDAKAPKESCRHFISEPSMQDRTWGLCIELPVSWTAFWKLRGGLFAIGPTALVLFRTATKIDQPQRSDKLSEGD
jgi:hypothetical protein